MKKNKFLLCLVAAIAVTGCGKKKPKNDLPDVDGTELRISAMHNQNFRMTYGAGGGGNGPILSSGNTFTFNGKDYKLGDLKPVWQELEARLKFKIKDVTPTTQGSAKNNFDKEWLLKNFEGVDILNGNAVDFNTYAMLDKQFVALDEYFDSGLMDDFKKFINDNPIVKDTITASDGHIYYAPYFDGFNSVERMSMMRADWVVKLLDGPSAYAADAEDVAASIPSFVYTATMPETLDKTINIVKEDGSAATTVTKKYTANIITKMSGLATKNATTLVQALRDHIDTTYNNFYGTTRSNLFVGQSAAYDADELVALLRCVNANSKKLTGEVKGATTGIIPLFPRSSTPDRTADIYRWAGNTWGVRGLESRKDYLYVDKTGTLQDARLQEDTYKVLGYVKNLYAEGLIYPDYEGSSNNYREALIRDSNRGFMTYDYNQTSTQYNETSAAAIAQADYKFMPVLPAVADWEKTGNYFQFTESIRSVKTDAWAINDGEMTPAKLKKALDLINYQFSVEGNKLMSFGPDAWLDGTMDYKGEQIPKLSAEALAIFNSPTNTTAIAGGAGGNYTNFLRGWLGGTFPIGYVKNQGVEYQLTKENGRIGESRIENAILKGTMKAIDPTLSIQNAATQNKSFYLVVPTTLPFKASEETVLNNLTSLNNAFKQGSSDPKNAHLFNYYIHHAFGTATAANTTTGNDLASFAEVKNYVATNLNCTQYIEIQQKAYQRVKDR